ncbi:MAG: hypothetical protein JKY65_17305, partial [Planctomycetes bacterium]|nr:hypothetical protein [Planctomycetota bacterium]
GLALAAGVLTLSATRALCPLCLLVAISALTASGLAFGSLPTPERRRFLQVFGLVLVLGCGLSLGRGLWLRSDDRARKARLEQIGGPSGPQLLLVTRPGCAFCTTLELDVLADPSLADALGRTRGLERIDEADPRAKAHAGGRGAPVLIALDAQGRSLGRLRGVEPIEAVRAFLVSVAPVRSR